jgi:hypothetical protein
MVAEAGLFILQVYVAIARQATVSRAAQTHPEAHLSAICYGTARRMDTTEDRRRAAYAS